MPLSAGARLGAYEIVAPLGAGGMGEVYRARDPRLGRDVALKLLPAAMAADAGRLARLEREARAVAGLNHPGIVTLYSLEEADGVRFLTMELVEGDGLDRLVTPTGLPLSRLLEIAQGVAEALAAAHERGVVHRDLKPANVMVMRGGRVKVLDFGLARLVEEGGASADSLATQAATVAGPVSEVGQVLGTLPYMAPEQVRGDTADARTDLFAFGTLIYELATGRRPFDGPTTADTASAILRDTPAPPAQSRPELPSACSALVMRCLEKLPAARPASAQEVVNALRELRRALESGSGLSGAGTPAPPAVAEPPSIGVLPFLNRSQDPEDEYFADGLADELLSVLARIKGLRVAARTSSFHFKGKDDDLATIGRRLNVATLLEGSVRKAGNRVRISVQLVKVADGFHLWSETYDRTLDDIFAVQDDIAQAVVKELRSTLLGADPDSKASGEARAQVAAAVPRRAADPEALRLMLQGRFLSDRVTAEDMRRGVECLEQAVALDPGLARAWAALARATLVLGAYGFAPTRECNARCIVAARRSVDVDPACAEGYVAIALWETWANWDWNNVAACLERALELEPDNADGLRCRSEFRYALGRVDDAVADARRAAAIDPLNPTGYSILARGLTRLGHQAEAEQAVRTAIELAPASGVRHGLLAMILFEQGRVDEALQHLDREPSDWARWSTAAELYHRLGRAADSDAALAALTRAHATDAPYQIARAHAVRGEVDLMFEWLERGYQSRDSGMALVGTSVQFAPYHGDPRWGAVLEKMGLKGV